jgi:hypothetical protein
VSTPSRSFPKSGIPNRTFLGSDRGEWCKNIPYNPPGEEPWR